MTATDTTVALLAHDDVVRRPLAGTMWVGVGQMRGRVVQRLPGGGWRRAEQGPAGPLVLEVRPAGDRLVLQVWGDHRTTAGAAEAALEATRRWAGLRDDPTGFADLVRGTPPLDRALRQLGAPVIGGLPRAAESFGRAVLGQLVQGLEAARSTAQLVAMLGVSTRQGIWAYPTGQAIGASPAHRMRTCGIPTRSAVALHRFAVEEGRLQRLAASADWARLDTHLRHLPGVGIWTSAETRLHLGDADAVSYGDYHIPAMIGWALGERTETDEAMAELLAPYAPHRGRVIQLVGRAVRHGLMAGKPRRGPRAALSAHRYW